MSNIMDYLKWRGDLTIEKDGLNNLDMLVLARISYLPLERIVPEGFEKSITLEDASYEFYINEMQDGVFWKKDPAFLKEAGKSGRFGKIKLFGSQSFMDYESKTQFYAITLDLGGGRYCVSFRGTDNTLVGWQEGFSLYSIDTLPSQKKAVEYFEKVVKALGGEYYLAGHSKGGNLAIYSSIFCDESTRGKILGVYNFDGPGFSEDIINSDNYRAVKDSINTFVPQSSVFGMMLEHDEDFSIVRSSKKSFMQHDIYSWEVEPKD